MNDFGFGTAFDTHLKCLLIHFLCISALHQCSFRASRVGVKQAKCDDIKGDRRFSQEHQGSARSLGGGAVGREGRARGGDARARERATRALARRSRWRVACTVLFACAGKTVSADLL